MPTWVCECESLPDGHCLVWLGRIVFNDLMVCTSLKIPLLYINENLPKFIEAVHWM